MVTLGPEICDGIAGKAEYVGLGRHRNPMVDT